MNDNHYFIQKQKYFKKQIQEYQNSVYYAYWLERYSNYFCLNYEQITDNFNLFWNHLSYYGKLRLSKGLFHKANMNRITMSPEYILGQIFETEGYWKMVAGFKSKNENNI